MLALFRLICYICIKINCDALRDKRLRFGIKNFYRVSFSQEMILCIFTCSCGEICGSDRTEMTLLVLSTGKMDYDRTDSASVVLSKAGGGPGESFHL